MLQNYIKNVFFGLFLFMALIAYKCKHSCRFNISSITYYTISMEAIHPLFCDKILFFPLRRLCPVMLASLNFVNADPCFVTCPCFFVHPILYGEKLCTFCLISPNKLAQPSLCFPQIRSQENAYPDW